MQGSEVGLEACYVAGSAGVSILLPACCTSQGSVCVMQPTPNPVYNHEASRECLMEGGKRSHTCKLKFLTNRRTGTSTSSSRNICGKPPSNPSIHSMCRESAD